MVTQAPIHVLLADESPSDALLLTAMLMEQSNRKVRVTQCDPTSDAVTTAWKDGSADVVVVGLSGELSPGRTLIREVRLAFPETPLVVCPGNPSLVEIEELAHLGVTVMLPKIWWTPKSLVEGITFAAAAGPTLLSRIGDPLTGLLTRSIWSDRLGHAVQRCRRTRRSVAVMLVDVDDFKRVNDAVGHDAGDAYLKEVARRLRSAVRAHDTVARLGGDEFAILVEDLATPEAALEVAAKVLANVAHPITFHTSKFPVAVSVGLVVLSADQRNLSPDWAMKAADSALYEAKRAGKNQYRVFSEDMDKALLSSLRFDDRMAQAVRRNEFAAHYQPIVEVDSGALVGFEALLRWTGGTVQGISPSRFVPVLERIGLLGTVSRAMFIEAIHRLGRWQQMTNHPLTMHVNLSGTQLADADLPILILDELASTGVEPRSLVIELTEAVKVNERDLQSDGLLRLRQAGVQFAIDDFGTGYNSLINVQRFHPDVLKIDREFVSRIEGSSFDFAIVKAQAVLAEELGITLVAEGVETESIMRRLRAAGRIDLVQGYMTGRPMSPDELEVGYRPFRRLCLTRSEGPTPKRDKMRSEGGRLVTGGMELPIDVRTGPEDQAMPVVRLTQAPQGSTQQFR